MANFVPPYEAVSRNIMTAACMWEKQEKESIRICADFDHGSTRAAQYEGILIFDIGKWLLKGH